MANTTASRILIVDDEAAQTGILCELLRCQGYDAVGCNSGPAALLALRQAKFDLLLTDLIMPGMGGVALIQTARDSNPDLVSVVMTGAGTIVTAVAAMKAGALDYVLKPFELSVILPVLARALTMRRLRVENLALHRRVEERTVELETANRALLTSEEELRNLAHWAVQAQEVESARLSLALHDNITQLLCAIQIRTQALYDKLPARVGPAKREFITLRKMLGEAAAEVERISCNLRPGVLDMLGLVAVVRATGAEFAKHTGVSVTLDCAPLTAQLSAKVELALYRILQTALNNVAQHARARHVAVCLKQTPGFIQLAIKDDGVGFEPGSPASGKETTGLGLLRIRERAAYVGGVLEVKSARRAGTQIQVRISLPGRLSNPSRVRRG